MLGVCGDSCFDIIFDVIWYGNERNDRKIKNDVIVEEMLWDVQNIEIIGRYWGNKISVDIKMMKYIRRW